MFRRKSGRVIIAAITALGLALMVLQSNRRQIVLARGMAPPPVTETFRVTLRGFKVAHESDDDILEGDGRRDEIFIRCDAWTINRGGRFGPTIPARWTRVMGDPVNHPERIAAGSAPTRWNWAGDVVGGLRTGDVFPDRLNLSVPPTGPTYTDRPPMVVWQGQLSADSNGLPDKVAVIVPSIWEWDSETDSDSQRMWMNGASTMMTDLRSVLQTWIDGRIGPAQPQQATGIVQTNFVIMGPGHKAGTRPIGWCNNHPPAFPLPGQGLPHYGAFSGSIRAGSHQQTSDECVMAPMLVLTLTSARDAIVRSGRAYTHFELHYEDQYDHGDYYLYLMLEKV